MDTLFIWGFGYTAAHLAAQLKDTPFHIKATVRTSSRATPPIETFLFDGSSSLPESSYHDATHMLISIPPDAEGDPVFRLHHEAITHLPSLRWLGYLSTTGVYGDTGGAWVDETSPLTATEPRQKARILAEQQWLRLSHSHIFRLAGIYGPQRNALEDLRRGTARRIVKEGQFFSRIHVTDIARVLIASMQAPAPHSLYNVCDDLPAPSHEVITYAAELLGVTPPPLIPYEEADLSPMAQSFYRSNRRVSNQRIKTLLGNSLTYPEYKRGLTALLKEK